jgi:hypothetical protein
MGIIMASKGFFGVIGNFWIGSTTWLIMSGCMVLEYVFFLDETMDEMGLHDTMDMSFAWYIIDS